MNYWAARVPFAQFLFGLGVPLILWVGGGEVIRGELAPGRPGEGRVLPPGARWPHRGHRSDYQHRPESSPPRSGFMNCFIAGPEMNPSPEALERQPVRSAERVSIEFDRVSFEYPREPSLSLLREEGGTAGSGACGTLAAAGVE